MSARSSSPRLCTPRMLTLANAGKIFEQLKGGASFAGYARTILEASTAAVGGDLGWVRPEQLPQSNRRRGAPNGAGRSTIPFQFPAAFRSSPFKIRARSSLLIRATRSSASSRYRSAFPSELPASRRSPSCNASLMLEEHRRMRRSREDRCGISWRSRAERSGEDA